MSPRPEDNDWDFTPVIDLIYSLSVNSDDYTRFKPSTPYNHPEEQGTPNTTYNGLGQGTQLGNFDKLWEYLDQPLSVPPPEVPLEPPDESVKILQTFGGNEQSPLKKVKRRDEHEGGDLADNDEIDDSQDLAGLTKTQRKKSGKKRRRQAEVDGVATGKVLLNGSENESEKDIQPPRTPDTKGIIYQIRHGSAPKIEPGRLHSGKSFRAGLPIDPPAASPHPVKEKMTILKSPPRESAYAAAAAKKTRLMTMLNETFIAERPYLSNISFIQQVSNTNITREGIHVFVDASNILIGFLNALKISRGQSINTRMPRQPISFHNLSLILERGRPTAKRIVVGSDNFSEMQEAKAIGYETNILDRVHKAKELSPRQKKYTNGSGTAHSGGSGSETTAAALAVAASVQYAPEKWVEQAVDEILHLKMMESVVDASEPSIMVLATGDAAEAEYSGGFLKMVERALGKGWKIELASFRHTTSGAYKRREFRQKWGDGFKTVELDDFVEVLLGSE
ncbi:hypothetical protein ABVK25_001220 [Lepraria finkii]|uniref:NYN domain-containing protein n=1 Tax=Lepraria finkii TaxID=1340010 RepID=A0ABR4BL16_9LECA